jgi:hypothetical protein
MNGRAPMRWIAVFLATTLSLAVPAHPGLAAGNPRCRVIARIDGNKLSVVYRLWNGGPRHDWRVKLFRDGRRAFTKVRTTTLGGRFRVEKVFRDETGREKLFGVARELESGRTCRVSVRI